MNRDDQDFKPLSAKNAQLSEEGKQEMRGYEERRAWHKRVEHELAMACDGLDRGDAVMKYWFGSDDEERAVIAAMVKLAGNTSPRRLIGVAQELSVIHDRVSDPEDPDAALQVVLDALKRGCR